jgi:hypothetical protein
MSVRPQQSNTSRMKFEHVQTFWDSSSKTTQRHNEKPDKMQFENTARYTTQPTRNFQWEIRQIPSVASLSKDNPSTETFLQRHTTAMDRHFSSWPHNICETEEKERRKQGKGGGVQWKSLITPRLCGGRQSIDLLDGSQASPARPSGKSSLKWKRKT